MIVAMLVTVAVAMLVTVAVVVVVGVVVVPPRAAVGVKRVPVAMRWWL